jgi:hypothetical protein
MNTAKMDLWTALAYKLRKGFWSLRQDLKSLQAKVHEDLSADEENVKRRLMEQVSMLDYVLWERYDKASVLVQNITKLSDSEETEESTSRKPSGRPRAMQALSDLSDLADLTPTDFSRYFSEHAEILLTSKAKELTLLAYTYWSLQAAIIQRINAVKKRKSGKPGALELSSQAFSLEMVDLVIDHCYSLLGSKLQDGTFAKLMLEKLPRPIPYFEKRDIEYPLELDGIIVTSGIGIPSAISSAPWEAISVVHEIGHDFDNKFALSKYYLRNLINDNLDDKLEKKLDPQIKQIWLGWLVEILPDVFGTLLLGPAYVYSLLSVLLQGHGLNIRQADDGRHPQTYIRGLIAIATLNLLLQEQESSGQQDIVKQEAIAGGSLQEEISALKSLWTESTFIPKIETVHAGPQKKEYTIAQITAPMEEYLRLLLYESKALNIFKKPGEGKKAGSVESLSLRELLDPYTEEEHSKVTTIAQQLKESVDGASIEQEISVLTKSDSLGKSTLSIIAAAYVAFLEHKDSSQLRAIPQNAKRLLEKKIEEARKQPDKQWVLYKWPRLTWEQFTEELLKKYPGLYQFKEWEKKLVEWGQKLEDAGFWDRSYSTRMDFYDKLKQTCAPQKSSTSAKKAKFSNEEELFEWVSPQVELYANQVKILVNDLKEAAKKEDRDRVLKKMVVFLAPGPSGDWPNTGDWPT